MASVRKREKEVPESWDSKGGNQAHPMPCQPTLVQVTGPASSAYPPSSLHPPTNFFFFFVHGWISIARSALDCFFPFPLNYHLFAIHSLIHHSRPFYSFAAPRCIRRLPPRAACSLYECSYSRAHGHPTIGFWRQSVSTACVYMLAASGALDMMCCPLLRATWSHHENRHCRYFPGQHCALLVLRLGEPPTLFLPFSPPFCHHYGHRRKASSSHHERSIFGLVR
ncbi:hypothetical protein J3F84DRAFT_333753 [Trichoderma pleuroticola]